MRANPEACRLFGYSARSFQGLNILDLVAPASRSTAEKKILKTVSDKRKVRPFACAFILRSGGFVNAKLHLSASRTEEGGAGVLNLVLSELTGAPTRKSSGIPLPAREANLIAELDFHRVRWEAILRQLPGGLLVVDAAGKVMLTNDWMQKLLKRPLPDAASASSGTWMPGWSAMDGRPFPVALWPPLRCLQTGEAVIRQDMIFDLDPQAQVYLEASASPIRDRDGRVIAVGCLFLDVTLQRRSAMASRISEARYREIFEQDLAANLILTPQLDLIACNRAAASLFGFSPAGEIFKASAEKRFPSPADRAALLARAQSPFAGQRHHLRLHRSDRRPVLVIGTVRAAHSADGRITELHAHFADVTERRRAERRIAILSTQLLKAQNEERRRLSHDLHDSTGQDLSALSMNLGLLEAALPAGAEKAAQYLAECKDLVHDCIRDIRTISYSLHPPLLDELGLGAALKWFVEGFSKRSSVNVALYVGDDIGRLGTLVEISLFRVVQEALTNVHRHSKSETAEVRLWRDANMLTLTVTDHGVGIPASSGGANGPGTGVGLASIRQQLSFLDGRLEISQHAGTVLKATIPAKTLRESGP